MSTDGMDMFHKRWVVQPDLLTATGEQGTKETPQSARTNYCYLHILSRHELLDHILRHREAVLFDGRKRLALDIFFERSQRLFDNLA